ncbi:AP endonuclease [Aliihoeflea aestuarii]|jgi:endonuclease/exonuclease/phosphatase (EEP) superfamily protein YafD|uniref:endonuclease/exonuclease/phosphatase family protein n=1 Tax=Aliihoeflea aestuarii TaxID=453840 RepID=UPI002093F7A0|nr:endonuclease/exonuclease/phosphatase family protein [Aliihoeflea aestuarii]MCO6389477.1 AP endonuclease [Aliihoeflea aestuarii]
MRKAWPILLRLAALAGVAALAGALSFGYLGWFHPAFDSFSHFRLHLAALLLVAVLPLAVLRYWPEAVFAMVLAIGAIGSTVDFAEDDAAIAGIDMRSTPVFRLFHLNLRFDNDRPDLVLSAIGAHRPDVITFTEASIEWREWLEVLEGAYPYQVICPPPSRIGGVAILSRRPFLSESAEACSDRGSFARVDIDFAGRPASVIAMHLGWPWPFGQQSHFERIAHDLSVLSDRTILAGDFNAVPWSQTVRQIADMGHFQVLRGIGPTWLHRSLPDAWLPWVGLPIDQVMVKDGIRVEGARTLDAVGSDHLPILVEFSVDAAPQSQSVEFALRN